jgi:hypothetical protein
MLYSKSSPNTRTSFFRSAPVQPRHYSSEKKDGYFDRSSSPCTFLSGSEP